MEIVLISSASCLMTILQNITFLMFFSAVIIVYNKQLIRNCGAFVTTVDAVVKYRRDINLD